MASVLVVSAADDWSATQVAGRLSARGASYAWFDPADFPRHASLAARFQQRWHSRLNTDTASIDLSSVAAVFYRRPGDFVMPSGLSGPELRFCRAQARVGLGGVLAALPARWINHPSALADHEYKPRQWDRAAAAGFRVPATLVTNQPEAVRAFAAEVGDLVVKPLSDPIVNEAGTYTPVWTRRLSGAQLDDLTGVDATAHLFQQWVDKRFEVRLIAIGQRLYSVAIHAGSAAARVDWRADYDSLTYQVIDTPPSVAQAVRRYLRAAGLVYGAFDFVVDPGGAWWWLECNAAGQWGWLAEECGLDIADALADALIGAS